MRVAEVIDHDGLRTVGAGGEVDGSGKAELRRVREVQKVDRGRGGHGGAAAVENVHRARSADGAGRGAGAVPALDGATVVSVTQSQAALVGAIVGDDEISGGRER